MNTARLRKIFNYTGGVDTSNLTWFMIEELFFGLQFGGRIQSILASLPPTVSWPYQATNANQLFEKKLMEEFLTVNDWVY